MIAPIIFGFTGYLKIYWTEPYSGWSLLQIETRIVAEDARSGQTVSRLAGPEHTATISLPATGHNQLQSKVN